MIVTASNEQARANHEAYTLPNGTEVKLDTYIGTNLIVRSRSADAAREPEPAIGSAYPMAYLVSQGADTQIAPHFHQNDQFQVFLSGNGRMGNVALRAVTVHFAGAFTPYGPIVAEGAPIEYITLRNGYDPGAQWMPGAKAKLKAAVARTHREATSAPVDAAADSSVLIEAQADGLGAWRHRIAPGASLTGVDPAGGAGQFWFSLSGAFSRGGEVHGPRSCLFVSDDERPLTITAGDDGLEVVIVQFPRRRGSAPV
jgi:hypothetical protein